MRPLLIAALLLVGCSDSNEAPPTAQYQVSDAPDPGETTGPDSGTPDTTQGEAGTGPDEAPGPSLRSDDEFAEAESHNHDHQSAPAISDYSAGQDLTVDGSDPAAVALRWGCAYRAKPAGEGSDAWAARLAPLATERAVAKLTGLSSPPENVATVVIEIGSTEVEPATGERGPVYRADCDTKVINAAGDHIADGAVAPVMVELTSTDAGWKVDDFAYGGIRFDR